jgi:hypothetical protein
MPEAVPWPMRVLVIRHNNTHRMPELRHTPCPSIRRPFLVWPEIYDFPNDRNHSLIASCWHGQRVSLRASRFQRFPVAVSAIAWG